VFGFGFERGVEEVLKGGVGGRRRRRSSSSRRKVTSSTISRAL